MTTTIGLIGCGNWGKYILRDLIALKADVIVNARTKETRDRALQQGAGAAHAEVQDMADLVDGFVVATPTSTHEEVILKLLPFNKPIFVEKPLTSNVHFAKSLKQSSHQDIFVMDKWRYHAGINTLAEKVRAGALGEIELLKTQRVDWGNPHPDVTGLWILLPHDLSIVWHILGSLPPLLAVVPLMEKNPELGALITLKGPDTPTVMIEISTLSLTKRRSVTLIGQQGSMELSDGYDKELHWIEAPPGDCQVLPKKMSIDTTMPLYLELAAFINYLKGGPPPLSPLAEGISMVEMIADIHKTLGLHS